MTSDKAGNMNVISPRFSFFVSVNVNWPFDMRGTKKEMKVHIVQTARWLTLKVGLFSMFHTANLCMINKPKVLKTNVGGNMYMSVKGWKFTNRNIGNSIKIIDLFYFLDTSHHFR